MQRARTNGWGRRSAAAGFLLLLLTGSFALFALPGGDGKCECGHGSCARRPAKASHPSCHEGGSHHAGSPAAQPGASCSLSSSCGCGHPHSPLAPHREPPAVLAVSSAGWLPDLGGFLAVRPFPAPAASAAAPEPPPPRSLVSA